MSPMLVGETEIQKDYKTSPDVHNQNWISKSAGGYKILKNVFEYLTVTDLLKARRVCSLWNDVIMMHDYWKVARLKGCNIKYIYIYRRY